MGNIKQDLLEFERIVGEPVEAVAIGRRRARDDFDHDPAVHPIGRDEALAILDYCFAGEIGGGDVPHPIYAWTASWALFLSVGDGVTSLAWLPRSPSRCVPEHGGSWWLCGPHDWSTLSQ